MPRSKKGRSGLSAAEVATLIAGFNLLPPEVLDDLLSPPGRGPWVPPEDEGEPGED